MRASAGQLQGERSLIRPLLVRDAPADAMTAYYALEHNPDRVKLTLHRGPGGSVDGFAAVCQTGRDLFVPLVVMRAPAARVYDLLRRALVPKRPYTVVTLPELGEAVGEAMLLERQQGNVIYRFEAGDYRPVINVMVQPGQSAFRYEIRVQDHIAAAAGLNWRTNRLADMYVYTEPDYRGRGWGKAVGSACIRDLLAERLLPLYTVPEANAASRHLAETLGFRDSGAREFEAQGSLRAQHDQH